MENLNFQVVVNYINFLFGVEVRARELHWKLTPKAIHESSENLSNEVCEAKDSIMEEFLSICGRESFEFGDIQAEVLIAENFEDLIDLVNDATVAFRSFVESLDCNKLPGVISTIDGLLTDINISKYRSELV